MNVNSTEQEASGSIGAGCLGYGFSIALINRETLGNRGSSEPDRSRVRIGYPIISSTSRPAMGRGPDQIPKRARPSVDLLRRFLAEEMVAREAHRDLGMFATIILNC